MNISGNEKPSKNKGFSPFNVFRPTQTHGNRKPKKWPESGPN